MIKLIKKYSDTSLIFRILIGLSFGAILGLAVPSMTWIGIFGSSNDIAMQAVGIGFIISVVQDSMETALNSSGDVLYTAAAEIHERNKIRNNE